MRILIVAALAAAAAAAAALVATPAGAARHAYVSYDSHGGFNNQRGTLEVAVSVAACLGEGTRLVLHPWRVSKHSDAARRREDEEVGIAFDALADVAHLTDAVWRLAGIELVPSFALVPPAVRLVPLRMDARCAYSCEWVRREVAYFAPELGDAFLHTAHRPRANWSGAAPRARQHTDVAPVIVPRLGHGIVEYVFPELWRRTAASAGGVLLVRTAPALREFAHELAAAALGAAYTATHMRLGDAESYALVRCPAETEILVGGGGGGGDGDDDDDAPVVLPRFVQLRTARGYACHDARTRRPVLVDDVLRHLAYELLPAWRNDSARTLFVATNEPRAPRIDAIRRGAHAAAIRVLTLDDALVHVHDGVVRLAALEGHARDASAVRSALEQEICAGAAAYLGAAISSWDQSVLRARAARPPTPLRDSRASLASAVARDGAVLATPADLVRVYRQREETPAARADYALYVELERIFYLPEHCENAPRPARDGMARFRLVVLFFYALVTGLVAYALVRTLVAAAASTPGVSSIEQGRLYAFAGRALAVHLLLMLVALVLAHSLRFETPLRIIAGARLVLLGAVSVLALRESVRLAFARVALGAAAALAYAGLLVLRRESGIAGLSRAAAFGTAGDPAAVLKEMIAVAVLADVVLTTLAVHARLTGRVHTPSALALGTHVGALWCLCALRLMHVMHDASTDDLIDAIAFATEATCVLAAAASLWLSKA